MEYEFVVNRCAGYRSVGLRSREDRREVSVGIFGRLVLDRTWAGVDLLVPVGQLTEDEPCSRSRNCGTGPDETRNGLHDARWALKDGERARRGERSLLARGARRRNRDYLVLS
jgi:hypothetical protein